MTTASSARSPTSSALACAALAIAVAAGAPACKKDEGAIVVGTSSSSERASAPVEFKLDSLDDREVSTASVLGRPTVITFVTTWDLSSQAQVDYLVPMAKRDGAKVGYVMVALQEPHDRELVQVFAEHLGVPFPVAMADDDLRSGAGSFGSIPAVPTTVILDRAARMVWRHVGLARPEEIREGLSGL